MRIKNVENISPYKIIVVDDEIGIVESLSIFFKRNGYEYKGVTNPLEAIELVKKEHFDLMILDFIMSPVHGDKVVEEVRKFNKELYILLLTGHKDLAPPLDTIKRLDIQGYCEKSDKFDQLLLLIESGIKSIAQMNQIKDMNKELDDASKKLANAYMDSIEILRRTVDAKDPYTRGHSDRVSGYSVLLGQKLGLSDDEIDTLRIGGLFHDIGKIGIPDSILLKPAKLTDDEYSEIKNHPSIGAHILSSASIFQPIIPIIKHHHERYDGKGYPSQLSGEKIPYLARIAAIADAYDAMTSRRAYRAPLTLDYVKNEINKNLGTQFDPKIGSVFLTMLDSTDYEEMNKEADKTYSEPDQVS